MVSFQVRVHGLDEVLQQFETLPENLEPAITRGLTRAAAEAVEQIQEEISTSYPPESLPSMPPHLRTGTLRRSVRIESVEPERVTVAIGGQGTGAPYAAYLEFGTSEMEPRPFIQPILERVAPEIPNIIAEEIDKDLQEAIK